MPDKWRRSVIVPICRNKGDIEGCTNYHGTETYGSHYETMGESDGAKTWIANQNV